MSAIRGRVTDLKGMPLKNAAVALGGISPEHRDIAALTGVDGGFSFAGLAAGKYDVLVSLDDYVQQSKRVTLEPDADQEVAFKLVLGTK